MERGLAIYALLWLYCTLQSKTCTRKTISYRILRHPLENSFNRRHPLLHFQNIGFLLLVDIMGFLGFVSGGLHFLETIFYGAPVQLPCRTWFIYRAKQSRPEFHWNQPPIRNRVNIVLVSIPSQELKQSRFIGLGLSCPHSKCSHRCHHRDDVQSMFLIYGMKYLSESGPTSEATQTAPDVFDSSKLLRISLIRLSQAFHCIRTSVSKSSIEFLFWSSWFRKSIMPLAIFATWEVLNGEQNGVGNN